MRACLQAVAEIGCPTVYVDSGSTDASLSVAAGTGATVVELDTTIPFTAARARNVGWRRLLEEHPDLRFVQFYDGDCVPASGWLQAALRTMYENPDVGAVCGRLREVHPQASVYNRLCDIEWDGPVGDIEEFGGVVLIRREALQQVDGFIDTVIAAEDTELSVRLRKSGWRLVRIAEVMGEHDANMLRFGQWWKRSVRSGHAHAEMHARHGSRPYRCRTRAVRSCLVWGLIIPALLLLLAWPTRGASLLLLLGYPLLYLRLVRRNSSRMPARDARTYAASCVLGKFPEVIGVLKFWRNRILGRQTLIIEHKPIPAD